MDYYVYAHVDPAKRVGMFYNGDAVDEAEGVGTPGWALDVVYIGKGRKARYGNVDDRSIEHRQWIEALRCVPGGHVAVLCWEMSEAAALSEEARLISRYRPQFNRAVPSQQTIQKLRCASIAKMMDDMDEEDFLLEETI